MKTYSVADFKANFSEILDMVQAGEEIGIAYGKKKEIVALLVPKPKEKTRVLGAMKGKMKAEFAADWKMTAEELLGE
jgi:antitoxin (DNA-binding transcriptional repressor) of toxin-antitoxin stability system